MKREERVRIFFETFSDGTTPFLEELEAAAHAEGVPVIRRDVQQVLIFLLSLHKPGTILEIGTAVGFSSALFCAASDARVVTIENDQRRIGEARENFRKAGCEDRIALLTGDAADVLPELRGPFDMIFLDAAQGQYIHFLPELVRLLRSGGLLVTDNILIGGDILESRFAVERRKRTIYKRMREYLRAITKGEGLRTTLLPVGDGLALTVKL